MKWYNEFIKKWTKGLGVNGKNTRVATLLDQGIKAFEIKEKAICENLFQVKTEARKREIASIILARLKNLDYYLIEKVAQSDTDTSKILVLYSIMKTDRLFRVNNFYEAIAMQTESDRLKVRCIDEINAENAKRKKPVTQPTSPTGLGTGGATIVEPTMGYKKTKPLVRQPCSEGQRQSRMKRTLRQY